MSLVLPGKIKMSIRTIETVVNIGEDRRLVLQLPGDIIPGRHHVVTMLDPLPEKAPLERPAGDAWAFPVLVDAKWPADMPLSREEMYDDDGR